MLKTGKEIVLLEKKIGHIDNDLIKLIIKDYNKFVPISLDDNVKLDYLRKYYKDRLHELHKVEKDKSKQLTIYE